MGLFIKYFMAVSMLFVSTVSCADEVQTKDPTEHVTMQPTFTSSESNEADHSNNGQFFPEDLVQGNREAKVVVVEYFAPTCPHCAFFHKDIYPQLKQKYIDTNKIAYIQREFIATKADLEAAALARCAGDMRRLAFYDVLLSQQQNWAFNRNYTEILTNIGQMGGVSPEQFKKCIEDENLGNALMNNTKLIARTPGFIGTPVFVINNKMHNGKFSLEELTKIIDAQLEAVNGK